MTVNEAKFEVAMARAEMTKQQVAETAGISRSRLNVILNSKKVTPISVSRISKALGVDVTEIIDDMDK